MRGGRQLQLRPEDAEWGWVCLPGRFRKRRGVWDWIFLRGKNEAEFTVGEELERGKDYFSGVRALGVAQHGS